MIRIIIAIDEENKGLGDYFEASEKYLFDLIEEKKWKDNCFVIKSKNCKYKYINHFVPSVCGEDPFIFVVFSHGSEIACIANGASYVNNRNANIFQKAFFYSTACLNGKKLGPELISKGCSTFVGFMEESNAFCKVEYKEISIKCDLACLFSFLSEENKTIKHALTDAISYYNKEIDKLEDIGDPIFQGALITNREALTLLGNNELKRKELDIIPIK